MEYVLYGEDTISEMHRDANSFQQERRSIIKCGSYRAMKLLEHAMKVTERVFEQRIRQKVKIDGMQFRFMQSSHRPISNLSVLSKLFEPYLQPYYCCKCNSNMAVKERSSSLLL